MGREISQRELRNDSGAVLREVERGETLVATRNGVPVAQLSPLHRRKFAPIQQVLDIFRDAPALDAESFFADIDAVVDQDPTPRG